MVELVNKHYMTKQESRIRKQMIAEGMIGAIIKVGRGFFYPNSPATTIILNREKVNRNNDTVLFMDVSKYTSGMNSFARQWRQRNVFSLAMMQQGDFTPFEELRKDYEAFFGFDESDMTDTESLIKDNMYTRQSIADKIEFHKYRRAREAEEKERLKKLEEMAKNAKWLTDNCGDGQYHDIQGLCKEVEVSKLLDDKASLDPKDYVNEDMVG